MLYYIGFYEEKENPQNRKIALSATNKMEYIMEVLQKLGIEQQIVSCSMTTENKGYPSAFKRISQNVSLKLFKTFGRKNLFTKLLDIYFLKLQLFCYLIKNVSSDDTLLVYHSPAYCRLIPLVKRMKKCKLVLEVEEIYGDVSGDRALRKKELAACSAADAFVFPTKMLSDAVNPKGKPYTVIHGTYMVEPDRGEKRPDGKIHVVYAGTFDPRKGGAAAATAAEFLDSRYHMHILGFGSEADKKNLLSEIERVSKTSECTVTFDGLLSGEDYIRFIQSCDIGLSTQNPDAAFNGTSFPSKILSYMANGLRVVSIRIPAIETSAVNEYMYYYDKQTPQEIAAAIKSVGMTDPYDSRAVISRLDESFSTEIKELLA